MAAGHWRKCMDQKYLGSWDVEEKDLVVTIKAVEAGEVTGPQGKQRKPLISFAEGKKQLVANATICKTISAIAGTNDVAGWVGTKVTLYCTETSAFGETVDCIRVRPQAPK